MIPTLLPKLVIFVLLTLPLSTATSEV